MRLQTQKTANKQTKEQITTTTTTTTTNKQTKNNNKTNNQKKKKMQNQTTRKENANIDETQTYVTQKIFQAEVLLNYQDHEI